MILLCLLIFFSSINLNVSAAENKTYYARILFDQVYLYKTPNENNEYQNIYFELPKTYFVELTDKENDFYKARYLSFTGYVKKDCVQAVENAPANPFLTNITFRVYAELSQTIREFPQTNSTAIATMPNLTKNISYISKLTGESAIEGRTNVWYFCKYTLDKDYYGYVYSDFCDDMQPIVENTEQVKYISNPTFEVSKQNIKTIPTSSNTVGIIVGILSVPALVFVFLIMKGTRILSNDRFKNKEVIDY